MKENKKIALTVIVIAVGTAVLFWNPFFEKNDNVENGKEKLIVYKDPNCGCCVKWIAYMERNGFDVEKKTVRDMSSIKRKYNISEEMESCHTAVIGNYFIEGHVPVEAVNRLLSEKPDIDGISLPGMPLGSPGMPGIQREPLEIHSIVNGLANEFMVIN